MKEGGAQAASERADRIQSPLRHLLEAGLLLTFGEAVSAASYFSVRRPSLFPAVSVNHTASFVRSTVMPFG